MNQQAKTKRSFPYVGLVLWVTLALVVLILGYTLMDTVGILGRMNTAATAGDDHRLNENHMDVYRYHVAQNNLYYQYMYIKYGMMSDPTGGLVQYMDANTYIAYMLPTTVGTGEFDAQAYDYAEQYLTYYCGAESDAALFAKYEEEAKTEVDEYIQEMKDAAEANGISFKSYIKNYIGAGVSERDIRTAMKYYYIGGKYAEKLVEDFASKVGDDDKTAYRDEHKENFYTTSYTSYKLVSSAEADVAVFKDCKTVDEVKTAIVDYYMDQKFEDQYKANFTDKNVADKVNKEQTKADIRITLLALAEVAEYKEVITDKETDDYEKAAYAIVKAVNKLVSTQTAKITEGSSPWVDINPKKEDGTEDTEAVKKLSTLQKWLFDAGRKAGDVTVEANTSTSTSSDGKETTNTTYTWYLVDETNILDTELTKNAYYILLSDDGDDVKENKKTGKEKADAFHAGLTATNTAEKFEELVKEYAPGYSASLIENISYDDMAETYKDLADWLYAEGRKEGDVSNIIEVKDSKDKVTGYIVALYMSENEETWKVNATEAIAGEKLQAWYDQAVKDYNVVIDYEPETTAEETTAAK